MLFQNVIKFSEHSYKNGIKHNCNKWINMLRYCNFFELLGF